MERVDVGMEVYSYDTRIGTVEGVEQNAHSDRPALVIRRDGGLLQAAAEDTYELSDGAVRIDEELLEDVIDAASARERSTEQHYAKPASQTRELVAGDVENSAELRIPIIQEEATVGKRVVERGGVRVHKRVHQREEVVEQPAWHEEVEVERVAIGQFVDVIPEPREEGDTLIIPILEEVLVVEKRLVVKEEIRITRRRSEETQQLRVTLRQEEAIVEHIDATEGTVEPDHENQAGA